VPTNKFKNESEDTVMQTEQIRTRFENKEIGVEGATEAYALKFQLHGKADGGLWLRRSNEKQIAVTVHRCFPWSHPFEWISLRDEEGNEAELIDRLERLEVSSAQALLSAIGESAFVFTIEAIESVQEEFELRLWTVRLKEGLRRFQTRLDSWPRELTGGGLLIQDVSGDLYRIPDPAALDKESTKILWSYVDQED
jgi:hypothetical protein